MPDERRSPVDQAIDDVEARAHEKLEPRQTVPLDLLAAAHRWNEQSEVTLSASADERKPALLLFDEEQLAWRAILLPPGTQWRIVPDRSALWQPGRST